MTFDFPTVTLQRGDQLVFRDGDYLKLPAEYKRVSVQQQIQQFYLDTLKKQNPREVQISVDPLGFNFVMYDFICYIGLIVGDSSRSNYNRLRKKYPEHKFQREYIYKRIISEFKLKNFEEYIPIDLVTQNLHELRGLNAKISQNIDSLMQIEDESNWEEKFDDSSETYRKIFVASRMIKFILDNTKFFIPDFLEEKLKMDYSRQFIAHRCISKIIKIYRNDFKKAKQGISFEGRSGKQLNGDKEYFEILIKILIENAIKYSIEPDRIQPKVEIKDTKDGFEISISSYGNLIPDNEEKYLFTKGFRSSVNQSSKEGTGMGLYNASVLCKHFKTALKYSKNAIHVEKEVHIGWNIFTILA